MSSRVLKLDLPGNVSSEEVRLLLALKLYETDRISIDQAAKLAGYSKRSFLEALGKQQIPILRPFGEDLEPEQAPKRHYVRLPLFPSQAPGSMPLTNADLAQAEAEEDLRRHGLVPR